MGKECKGGGRSSQNCSPRLIGLRTRRVSWWIFIGQEKNCSLLYVKQFPEISFSVVQVFLSANKCLRFFLYFLSSGSILNRNPFTYGICTSLQLCFLKGLNIALFRFTPKGRKDEQNPPTDIWGPVEMGSFSHDASRPLMGLLLGSPCQLRLLVVVTDGDSVRGYLGLTLLDLC